MSTILVTGASGTLGREVAKRLAQREAPARLALRDPSCDVEGAEGLERARFDFHDPSGFGEALRGVDRVFLLRPPQLANVRHDFEPFLLAMLRSDVKRVVFLSVRGAERNPLLPHRRIEKLLERSGVAWTHLRPNDWMQNFAAVHRDDIRTRGEIWAPAGKGRTSFVDARDVAEAAAEVLTGQGHDGRAYALTGREELDLYEVAAALSKASGRPVTYRNPGAVAFLRHVRAAGRPLPLGLVMTGVYTIARLGLAGGVSPDLERLIGRPPTAFRAFAEDHAAVWR